MKISVITVAFNSAQTIARAAASVISQNRLGFELEYIVVFLDSVGDEMAAMSTAHNSLHERFVQALAAIDEWENENKILKATIASLEKQLLAAHDNR